MAIFKGAGVAIVTPMYDNEEVNYDKLEELINMQIDNGTDAIIIAGTTGESPCLLMNHRQSALLFHCECRCMVEIPYFSPWFSLLWHKNRYCPRLSVTCKHCLKAT